MNVIEFVQILSICFDCNAVKDKCKCSRKWGKDTGVSSWTL